MRPFLTMAGIVLMIVLAGGVAEASPPGTLYPESPAGLEQQINDLLVVTAQGQENLFTTHIRRLVIPSYPLWFSKVFGSDHCRPLVDEYSEQREHFGELKDLFRAVVEKGQTEVSVVRLSDAEDLRCRGLQKRAFHAMRYRQHLYTVAMTRPGERSGTKLWSFVYVDGSFRLAGKMKELTKVPVETHRH